VCLYLYIPWKFGEWGSTPCGATGPSLSFFLFFFCFLSVFLFVRHTTMLGTESLHGAYTHWTWGGTGISPPDTFIFRSSFRSRSRSRSRFRFCSSSSSTTSGDIFYCSGSRQLNHSSFLLCWLHLRSPSDTEHSLSQGQFENLWIFDIIMLQIDILW